MGQYLHVRFDLAEQESPDQLESRIEEALQETFATYGLGGEYATHSAQVSIEEPLTAEAAIVLGLIGLSIKLIDLLMYLMKRTDQKEKLELEQAKSQTEQVGEIELLEWRQEFVERILLGTVLPRVGARPVNVTIRTVER